MASSNNTGNNEELTPSVEETLLNESGSIARVKSFTRCCSTPMLRTSARLRMTCAPTGSTLTKASNLKSNLGPETRLLSLALNVSRYLTI